MNQQGLKDQLVEAATKLTAFKFGDDIFHTFISQDKQHLDFVNKSRGQLKTVCGGHIPESTLSFQCFDCAPDPHHMFCQACFSQDKHQNHKVIMRHNIGGCCDCGDEQTIIKESFCRNHRGFQDLNIEAEIDKIPKDIQQSVQHCIITMTQLYMEKMDNIIEKIPRFDSNVLKMYEIAITNKYQFIVDQIDQLVQMKEYHTAFKEALYYHQILFTLIEWITEESLPFVMLVTNTLMTAQINEHSLFAVIMQRQVHIESFSPRPAFKLEKLLFSFHSNNVFKLFSQGIYLKHYKQLWAYVDVKDNPYTQPFEKLIADLLNCEQRNKAQMIRLATQADFMHNAPEITRKYIEASKELVDKFIVIYRSEYCEHHTQYISQLFQTELFRDKNIKNVYEIYSEYEQLVTQKHCSNGYMLINIHSIFRLRFEYSFCPELLQQELESILGNNYEQFTKQELAPDALATFPIDQFVLTALINVHAQIKPAKLVIDNKPADQEFESGMYYLLIQLKTIDDIKLVVSQLLNSDRFTQQSKSNIAMVLLSSTYKLIVDHRNQYQDEDISECMKTYINTSANKELAMTRLCVLQFKNANILDRIFTLFLSYKYCVISPQNSQQFKQYLQQQFGQSEEQLQLHFNKILFRCIQSMISLYRFYGENMYNIYIGVQQACNQENLESCDLAFVKLYIYLFGFEAIGHIIEALKITQCNEQNEFLIELLLKLLASDKELFSVCASFFKDVLPNDLQNCLEKIVSNIFILKTYHSFKHLQQLIQVLPMNTKACIDKAILQICDLDTFVRELKLKPDRQHVFDPSLFLNVQGIRSQIVEKLMDQQDIKINHYFGNGIDYDISMIESPNRSVIRTTLLQILSNGEALKLFMNILRSMQVGGIQENKQLISLLYVLLKGVKLNDNSIYEQFAIDIANLLKEFKQHLNENSDLTKYYDYFINCLEQQQIQQVEVEKPKDERQAKKFEQMRNKFQNKIMKFQASEQYVNTVENGMQEEETEVCQSCKQPIKDSTDPCMPILIQGNSISKDFEVVANSLQTLRGQNYNFTQLTISNCKHLYHKQCLDQVFHGQNILNGEVPIWFIQKCPICKFSFNLTLPMVKEDDRQQIVEFQDWLLNTSESIGHKNYLNTHYMVEGTLNRQFALGDIFLQLFSDLLWQLMADPIDFQKKNKQLLFYTLLKITNQSFKGEQFTILPGQFTIFQKSQSFILDILHLIVKYNFVVFHIDIKDELVQSIFPKLLGSKIGHDSIQFTTVLSQCFGFEYQPKEQALTVQNYAPMLSLNDFKQTIFNSIKSQIGSNFKVFYNKYFTQGCSMCKYYPKVSKTQTTEETYICLICFKQFCQISCRNNNDLPMIVGNLNKHSKQAHSGNSIYISLQTCNVLLQSSPITITQYKCLFYNSLGQKIEILNSTKLDWSTYTLDERVLMQLVDILLLNNQKSLIQSVEVMEQQIDFHGQF